MKCHSVMTHWLLLVASTSAFAAPQSSSNQIHQPKDGVINVYGPGGPDTALRHAAQAFTQQSGVKVNIIAGPESKWSQEAQKRRSTVWFLRTIDECLCGNLSFHYSSRC